MSIAEHQFVYDTNGNKTYALIPISEYEAFFEALEDAHDVQVVTQRRSEPSGSISLEELRQNLGL
jgi:hypothetical protein